MSNHLTEEQCLEICDARAGILGDLETLLQNESFVARFKKISINIPLRMSGSNFLFRYVNSYGSIEFLLDAIAAEPNHSAQLIEKILEICSVKQKKERAPPPSPKYESNLGVVAFARLELAHNAIRLIHDLGEANAHALFSKLSKDNSQTHRYHDLEIAISYIINHELWNSVDFEKLMAFELRKLCSLCTMVCSKDSILRDFEKIGLKHIFKLDDNEAIVRPPLEELNFFAVDPDVCTPKLSSANLDYNCRFKVFSGDGDDESYQRLFTLEQQSKILRPGSGMIGELETLLQRSTFLMRIRQTYPGVQVPVRCGAKQFLDAYIENQGMLHILALAIFAEGNPRLADQIKNLRQIRQEVEKMDISKSSDCVLSDAHTAAAAVVAVVMKTTESSEECCVCMDAFPNSVFLDCGHISACFKCAQKLKKCPQCRATIVRCIKTYATQKK